MKKAFFLGITASFFFAFTFVLNRSMNLSGGSWIWSASLRFLFSLPIMALIVKKKYGLKSIHTNIKQKRVQWLLWSIIGFGLFYAPLTYAGVHGEAWLIAASWQITIVMGVLMAPLFGKKIPLKNLFAGAILLIGVFFLQYGNFGQLKNPAALWTLLPVIIAAAAYPLGNRKMMEITGDKLSTAERVYGMMLCSLPFWLALSFAGISSVGLPSILQTVQAFIVAVFSGITATLLFFKATDLVKDNQKQLALVESTQSGEVIFSLLGGILILREPLPDGWGWAGIFLIVFGMILNSILSADKNTAPIDHAVEK